MTKEIEIKEINKKIEVLRVELKEVKGTKTEVYTRIVGYYRSVKNWNKGRRAEFDAGRNYENKGSERIKNDKRTVGKNI